VNISECFDLIAWPVIIPNSLLDGGIAAAAPRSVRLILSPRGSLVLWPHMSFGVKSFGVKEEMRRAGYFVEASEELT
jgi:hypothetical protein